MKVAEYRNLGLMIDRRDESPARTAKPTRRDRAGDLVVVEEQDGRCLPLAFVTLTGRH